MLGAADAALVAHIAGRRLLPPATQMLLTATQINSEECEERREHRRKATSFGHSSDNARPWHSPKPWYVRALCYQSLAAVS